MREEFSRGAALFVVIIVFGVGAVGIWAADDLAEAITVTLGSVAAAVAAAATLIASATHAHSVESRREDEQSQLIRRLERVGELATHIGQAAEGHNTHQWRPFRQRLRLVLAALGPEQEGLRAARRLAETESTGNAEQQVQVRDLAQAVVDEAIEAMDRVREAGGAR